MHVVAEFGGVRLITELIDRLSSEGIYAVPVEDHAFSKGNHIGKIILGYSQHDEDVMHKGIMRFKKIIIGSTSPSAVARKHNKSYGRRYDAYNPKPQGNEQD